MSRKRRLIKLSLFASTLLFLMVGATLLHLCNMQAQNFAHPYSVVAQGSPANFGISNWRDVRFQADDGVQLNGWYIPPDARGTTLLFVHGHGGNRAHFAREATLLAANGYGMLLFDLRDCGTSAGSVTSMGYWEALDVQAAYAFLDAQAEVSQIVLHGESMGGAAAIRAMAQLPDAAALIVESTYASLVSVVGDGVRAQTGLPPFPFAEIIVWLTGQQSGANLFDVNSEAAIAQIDVPVLIMHGTDDGTIPVAHGERLFAAANEPKELWIVPNAGHGGLIYVDPQGFAEHVLSFLERLRG